MTTQNFLVEIGTEELPPKALKTLATSFADNVEAELNQAGLTFNKIEWFAAPRRLAVKVLNLATQQPSKEIEKRGPAVSAAFDAEGKPTKAAEGWARGCGITVEQAGRFISATLKPRVRISSESDAVKALALHENAHHACFIANSLNFPVKCEAIIEKD